MIGNVVIRALDEKDVGQLAQGHVAAFPRFFLTALGTPFLVQFYTGFLKDPTAVTAVAVHEDGRVLGAAVGTTEPVGFFSRLLRRQLVGFMLASARAASSDPRRVPRLLRAVRYRGGEAPNGPAALLSSIYVAPGTSGGGLGTRLLEAWCLEASVRGSTRARLATDADDNDNVNGFYRRCGWALEEQYTTPEGRTMNWYAKDL
ncbi:GNAT family N-acetyltransferase [Terrabacter sp. LjRoot27]|uniref:GNAT family N-acetyltransferase n=1 Tax=Terrabacter sp. LjRoot27 TaxID=3342306 RepID=UPI003ED0B609